MGIKRVDFIAIVLLTLLCGAVDSFAQDTIKTSPTEIERINQERREIEKRVKKREAQIIEIERQKAERGITGNHYYVMSYKIIDGDTVFIDQLPALFKFAKMKGKRAFRRQLFVFAKHSIKNLLFNRRI